MNITRVNKDSLNAVVTINIEKKDYFEKVKKILLDYRKSANIPGFRKGQVPMGLINKKYGKAVTSEEINKILQESLGNYFKDEKLDILGNPIPLEGEKIDWGSEKFTFSFEIGLSPAFDVKLKGRKAITQYNIITKR